MNGKSAALGAIAVIVAGCSPNSPVATVRPTVAPSPINVPTAPAKVTQAAPRPATPPMVALVEPYLVAVAPPRPWSPPPLSGRILPSLPPSAIEPIVPANPLPNPSATEPAAPPRPAPAPSAPKRTPLSPAIVKLFQDERAHSVEDARRRLAAAATRAAQTTAEAKRQWGFVKDGFVAQKQAENADAVARDAASEQADAQKTLEEAQQRQRDAKRDIESALRNVAEVPSSFALAQLKRPTPTYQPVPETYRLSILGTGPVTIALQNGVVVRRVELEAGEAGAWLVRCPEPSKLRVGVGSRAANVIVRPLPGASASPNA